MLITHAPKRCTRCKLILNPDEIGQRWCNKCRSKKRNENDKHKKNQDTRDSIAAMFGYDRKGKRENQ